ncbi:MAG: DNA-binding MarR family transcriptional regulator [Cognaticolwellia sp.]|jgi:DNA-binding MarR family transcriptional regulator
MDIKSFNPLEQIGFLIARTHRTMLNTLQQRLADNGFDITSEQAIIIMTLYQEDGIAQQEIANAVFKDKSSVKRLIDNMERKNLIVRVPDQNDRRNKLIYLTHGGKALREEMSKVAICVLNDAQENIDKEEIKICKKVLRQIFNNLNNLNNNLTNK